MTPLRGVNTDLRHLLRLFYERLWNHWDDTAVDTVLHSEVTLRGSLGVETVGRDGWRGYRDRIRAGSLREQLSRPNA